MVSIAMGRLRRDKSEADVPRVVHLNRRSKTRAVGLMVRLLHDVVQYLGKPACHLRMTVLFYRLLVRGIGNPAILLIVFESAN